MNRLMFGLLLALTCVCAQAQVANVQPFQPTGNTITITAATSAPTPVQAVGATGSKQYILTNIGSVVAFISFGSSADAAANCIIPTSTSRLSIPILPLSQFTMTTDANSFFCGITASSTAIIYISVGTGS